VKRPATAAAPHRRIFGRPHAQLVRVLHQDIGEIRAHAQALTLGHLLQIQGVIRVQFDGDFHCVILRD
jgi:hypothetical protein